MAYLFHVSEKDQLKIANGPGKFNLMLSLMERQAIYFSVVFKEDEREPLAGIVQLMTPVKDHDESEKSPELWCGQILVITDGGERHIRDFYYDSRTRTGHISKVKKSCY